MQKIRHLYIIAVTDIHYATFSAMLKINYLLHRKNMHDCGGHIKLCKFV